MKSIKEASQDTGITSQNIRYYEKQGLISPARSRDNAYREYSEEDILRLQQIRLFRQLGMPIGEIRRLLQGEMSLEDALKTQAYRLESERERLDGALKVCASISETQLADLDAEKYLDTIREKEKSGSVFGEFVNDYLDVIRSEVKRDFSFMPYSRCDTPEEFTEDLLRYAGENDLNLVMIKESMSPRFMMDGVEYHAWRTSGRYGIVVHCEMTHPEDYIPAGMPEKKYRRYRILSVVALPLLIFLFTNLWIFLEIDWFSMEGLITILVAAAMFISNLGFIWYCYGKNFRG